MTDTAAVDLGKFDNKPVLGQSIKITRAGDGLSDALGIEPRQFHLGEKVYVVLETEVTALGPFKPIKDTDGLRMEHTLAARRATIVPADLVSEVLDEQQRRIDAAAGVERLPFDGDADADDDGGSFDDDFADD